MTLSEKIKQAFGKDAIQKLKDLIVPEKFQDAKLKDGTIIRYDGETPAKGARVMCITSEGEVPCPDGTHEMESGEKITVKAGIIDEVVPAGQPEEQMQDAAQTPAPAATPEPMDVKKTIESIVKETVFSKIEALEGKFAAIEKENVKLKSELEKAREANKQIFSMIEKIADEPSDEPAETPKGAVKKDFFKELKKDAQEFRKSAKDKN